jgi:cytochrome c-type biogenesis protein CcmH/NrfF
VKAWAAPVAVVVAAAIGGFAFANLHLAPAPASAQLAVEQRLMCPQCEAVRLDVCDRPICADMKADIARRLQSGESPDSIVDSYRQAYGSSVLSSDQPPGAAALLPWAALAVGLLALAGVAFRRSAR